MLGETIEVELTIEQKHAFIKNYYASPFFDSDDKKALKELIFTNDDSDKGKNIQLLCDQSLPDADQKQRIWTQLTNMEDQGESLLQSVTKMQGFFQRY